MEAMGWLKMLWNRLSWLQIGLSIIIVGLLIALSLGSIEYETFSLPFSLVCVVLCLESIRVSMRANSSSN